jgi:hypothetical protein
MTTREQLIQEIEQAPDFLIEELLDFLLFAKARRNLQETHSALMQQSEQQEQPIWERVAKISAQVPDEEWAKLPKDLSRNLDHYLYGSPKDDE